jgi:hypothetical protein
MKPVKQKIIDKGNGDCFRACMASMLELPNDDRLPHIDKETWFFDWGKLLERFGMSLNHDFLKIWRDGYWIASLPSLNYEKTTHVIIMKDTKVEFDPSTKNRYRKGKSLLGSQKVKGGYWLEVNDVSKLKNLDKFRSELLSQDNKAIKE